MISPSTRPGPVGTVEAVHGTIVCGVSSTAEGLGAVQLAAALASRLGLRLVLVHALARSRRREHGGDVQGRREAERMLEAVAGGLAGAEVRLVVGSRVDALAQVAADEGADVIVLGSRARGARAGQLRCSLARELEAAQTVPVVIAPPATRPRAGRRLAVAEAATAG